MAISWRRYKESGELVAVFTLKFPVEPDRMVDILAGWLAFKPGDTPSKREIEQYVRFGLFAEGDIAFTEWGVGFSDKQIERYRETARDHLIELWPDFADDFRKIEP